MLPHVPPDSCFHELDHWSSTREERVINGIGWISTKTLDKLECEEGLVQIRCNKEAIWDGSNATGCVSQLVIRDVSRKLIVNYSTITMVNAPIETNNHSFNIGIDTKWLWKLMLEPILHSQTFKSCILEVFYQTWLPNDVNLSWQLDNFFQMVRRCEGWTMLSW